MIYTTPLQNYVRNTVPSDPQSQAVYLNLELRKIEQTLQSIQAALAQIATRVA
jgi:hypothetical protein